MSLKCHIRLHQETGMPSYQHILAVPNWQQAMQAARRGIVVIS